MALSSPGIGSGLDVAGLVSQLMALERRPLSQLGSQEAVHQAKISAYGSLKGALSSFQSAVKSLSAPAKFSAMQASIADTDIATVAASVWLSNAGLRNGCAAIFDVPRSTNSPYQTFLDT